MIRRAFTYGSLIFPEVMQIVCGRPLASVRAEAPGIRREALHGAVYPGAVRDANATAPGRLYEGLGPADLARLDAFESDFYDRVAVRVVTAAGVPHDAWIYLVGAPNQHLLAGKPWDFEGFAARELPAYLEGCRRFALHGWT